jgi:hypothetical protein
MHRALFLRHESALWAASLAITGGFVYALVATGLPEAAPTPAFCQRVRPLRAPPRPPPLPLRAVHQRPLPTRATLPRSPACRACPAAAPAVCVRPRRRVG